MIVVIYKIKENLEQRVRMSFTKDEVHRKISLRRNELTKDKDKKKSEIALVVQFIMHGEVFKDIISNLFIKAYITQHNVSTVKKMVIE